MPLGTDIGLGPGYTVLDENPAPPKKGAQQPPIFSPCLLCQTAGFIKMSLGMEVGLGPGGVVLDGDSAPPTKGAHRPPLFCPLCSGTVTRLGYC